MSLDSIYQMQVLRACSIALALCLIFRSDAACQTLRTPSAPECAEAADRLHAEPLQEKAWGAHLAAVCKIPELAEEIGAELERLNPEERAKPTMNSDFFWTAHAMLDALIQLRRPLSASVLTSVAKGFPIEATILTLQNPLMLQNARENAILLTELRAHPATPEWVAINNALARLHAPGFAATLLAEVQISHAVLVSDTGAPVGRGSGGSIAGGGPTMRVPAGFPPIALYRLTGRPAEGGVSNVLPDEQYPPGGQAVSAGAVTIYSQRTMIEPGTERVLTWAPESSPESYCSQCMEIEYLAEIANTSKAELERCVEPQTEVKWSNLFELDVAIRQALTKQESALKQLTKSLISSGALDGSEHGVRLHVEVAIQDQRSDRSVPLPTYGPVEFQVP